MEIGLSFGSNKGDRLAALAEARDTIGGMAGVEEIAASAVYETEPVDVEEKHRDEFFLNAALIVESGINIRELAGRLRRIEARMGRERSADRNAPRIIDVDVIYAEDLVIAEDSLAVPHPRWAERRFVVQPLAEIRPDLVVPGCELNVKEVLDSLPMKPGVSVYSKEW